MERVTSKLPRTVVPSLELTVHGRRYAVVLLSLMLTVNCSRHRDSTTPPPANQPAAGEQASTAGRGVVVGKAPVPGTTSAFVVLSPQGEQEVPPPDTQPVMDQVQLTFIPATLIVRAGYPVQFHSSDEELHNINVKNADTREQAFNVAIPPGQTFEHTFKNPGFYDVNCDIHPAMSAQIFVATSPYVVIAERDGRFTFQDVVPGAYTLSVYAGTRRLDQPIQVAAGRNDVQIGNE
jgi:plastocyanin